MRDDSVIESNLRNFIVAEKVSENIWRIHIYERIHVFLQFQQIGVIV